MNSHLNHLPPYPFARLRELRVKLDNDGKHYLDNFLDETPR